MSVPVHTLNKEQKAWYANLVISAILADDEISPSEVDFLKRVIGIVDDPAKKKELMQRISSKKRPPLIEPKGINKEILAAIFMELNLIMISDLDFADDEKAFLKEVAELFGFEKTYSLEILRWAENGLNWKASQRSLIPDEKLVDSQVPLSDLNSEQKKWYAQTLIATIMLDGAVDESELSFLKAAVSFVDSKQDQKELMSYVRNRMAPRLKQPPEISESVLILIFIEIMRIISADESMSYAEHAYLKQISDLCGFSNELFSRLVDWCNQGITWMQNKNPLISSCRLVEKKGPARVPAGFEINPDNSSILNRDLECFVCGSADKVKAFQLKPHTQEPSRNIFGIQTYFDALEGFEYIDYNLVKVIICPRCYFASTNKDLFKKTDKDTLPEIINAKFKASWLKDLEQRKATFKGAELNEISSIKRSKATVLKSYQLAVRTADALSNFSSDESQKWQAVTLMLTLSEIVMNFGNVEKAEEFLNVAKERANALFKHASQISNTFKAARLLIYIALYFNDVQSASPYLDFLREYQARKLDELNQSEQAILKKVLGEVKKAYEDRSEYKKENLIGFHKDAS